MFFDQVENVPRYLRSKNGKIVGQYDEQDTENQSIPVFPEIFINRGKVLHRKVCTKIALIIQNRTSDEISLALR